VKRRLLLWCSLLILAIPSASWARCQRDTFIVAIDVGHSERRPGAHSARGVGEFYFNRDLARIVLDDLARNGFTQSFIIDLHGSRDSLTSRTAIANKRQADLLISIHHDSVQPRYLSTWSYEGQRLPYCDLFSGYSIFYSDRNPQSAESLEFAKLLGSELRHWFLAPTLHHAEKIKGENRPLVDRYLGIYQFDDLIVLRTADMPAVLLESGVIVNRDEEPLLLSAAHRRKIAGSIVEAVARFCDGKTETALVIKTQKTVRLPSVQGIK
jgi:N-acetylmuramoyl-L-alanine amidase